MNNIHMLELFHYDFIIRAITGGIIAGIIAPTIGTFLVVRRYSLLADTLSHVSLLGIALGLLIGINPIIMSVFTAFIASLGIDRLRTKGRISGESVLAIFLSGSLALALIIFSILGNINTDLQSYLFGSISTITQADLNIIFAFGVIVLITVILFYRRFYDISFNEELARIQGVNISFYNQLLIALAAITVSLTLRIVGILLIGALMVIPVVSALQLNLGFKKTIISSVVFSVLSVVTGIVLAYYYDLVPGGTIVAVLIFVFLLSIMKGGR